MRPLHLHICLGPVSRNVICKDRSRAEKDATWSTTSEAVCNEASLGGHPSWDQESRNPRRAHRPLSQGWCRSECSSPKRCRIFLTSKNLTPGLLWHKLLSTANWVTAMKALLYSAAISTHCSLAPLRSAVVHSLARSSEQKGQVGESSRGAQR